jgi:hypothetical protein
MPDTELLQFALIGFQEQRRQIDIRIAQIQAQLGGNQTSAAEANEPTHRGGRKRRLSAAGRKRIAEATRKRWAVFRRQQQHAAKKRPIKKVPAKKARARKAVSPAVLRRRLEGLKKARAAMAAKRAASP